MLVLIMDRLLGRESMGGGDIMLFAVAGFYFGWQQCLFLIVVACVIGLLFAFAGMALQQRDNRADAELAEKIKEKPVLMLRSSEHVLRRFPLGLRLR